VCVGEPPLSEAAAALPGLISLDATQAGRFVICGDLPCFTQLTELRISSFGYAPGDGDGQLLSRLAPRLSKLALSSLARDVPLLGLAAAHAGLRDLEVSGMDLREQSPSDCESMQSLKCVTALKLTRGRSFVLPYEQYDKGIVLRRSSVLHWHALVMPPALASFVYAGCCPVLLCATLPLLADALGQTLRRLELHGCIMPRSASEGCRASRSLVLFERLQRLTIKAAFDEAIVLEGLEGLTAPMAEAPVPGATPRWLGPALRAVCVHLPAVRLDAAAWSRCMELVAASQPPLSVQFELFDR
jgi:hypothetical protein